jgi:hypothetical protein
MLSGMPPAVRLSILMRASDFISALSYPEMARQLFSYLQVVLALVVVRQADTNLTIGVAVD